MSKNQVGKNNGNYRHGGYLEFKKEYNSWRAMKERCDNKKYHAYNRYGGRGIRYCERWKDFANFLHDMGRKPTLKYSLDRIDNDGDYCPENCRWATQAEQVRNSTKKLNAMVTSEMLEDAAVKMYAVYNRINRGWSIEKALKTSTKDARAERSRRIRATWPFCKKCGKKCSRKRAVYCSLACYREGRKRPTRSVSKGGKMTEEKSCEVRKVCRNKGESRQWKPMAVQRDNHH